MKIYLCNEQLSAGPISATQQQLISHLQANGTTDFKTLRKKAGIIRSAYFKALDDLRKLGCVKYGSSAAA